MILGSIFEQVDNTIPRIQVTVLQDFPKVVIVIHVYREKQPHRVVNQTNQPAVLVRRDRVPLREGH